jgi:signal transduction histidine kinase
MNRLWVWISLVIVAVVLIVALFPFVYRHTTIQQNWGTRPAERIPMEERAPAEFTETIERRIWINISRTLVVGAVLALVAGILLTRWLVAPIHQLEQGARAIAKHELDHRVPVKGSTEFRSVAVSFNQMASELEQQETLRQDMLADVTHELRHPVHLLQGSLQAILDGVYPLNMEEIDRLLEQTHLLTSLVDDLHELSLAEAHELPLYKQRTDMRALVIEMTEIFQPLTTPKAVTLKTEVPETPVYSLVDPDRIRQALGNLLSNALRYTPQEGAIKVSLTEGENSVLIKVEDTGTGISAENLPRVFDRFYRGDPSRNRGVPGTGLGLAIAQAIVQAHDGQIEAESQGINQGSVFTIRLPLDEYLL